MLEGMRDKAFSLIGAIKASLGSSRFVNGGAHAWSMVGQKDYAIEGYGANPTVFACINLLATSFARVPLKVRNEEGEHLVDSAYQKLINFPNPDEGGVEFRIAQATWELLLGNCFTEKLVSNGVPTELWNWQPYQMSIASMKGARMPSSYIYRKGLDGQRIWDVNNITGLSDMLHWRSFNPSPDDSSLGMSPLQAAAYAADSYNSAQKWRYNQIKNGGVLDGILSPKSPESMTREQKQELESSIQEKFSGAENSGRKLGVSTKEMTFTSLGSSLRDAEWLGGTKLNKQEITEVYKVPGQLIGIEGSQTYANFEQALKALFYFGVIPMLDLYVSEMNRWLGPSFPGETLTYDKADIDALEPDRAQRRKDKQDSGAYSINEIREEYGDEARDEPEADEILTDPSKIPLGMDAFSGLSSTASDVAKSLMRAGVPRSEAESKAMEWLYDSKE